MKPTFEVGYVARTHGLSGELGIKRFDPASAALLEVSRLLFRKRDGSQREFKIISARPTEKDVLVRVEAIHRREEAKAFVGAAVLVFREDLSALAEGEYFQGDLVGLLALSEQGEVLGQVEGLLAVGTVPNLVIRKGESEIMVPFADEFVSEVRLKEGAVVIRPPDFLE